MENEVYDNIEVHPCVGRHRVENTSALGLWCGAFALGISTKAQLGIELTLQDFEDAYCSEEMRDFNESQNWLDVVYNFHDEQLALVLRLWGRRHGFDDLQLGVILQGSFCLLLGKDDKFLIVGDRSDMETEDEFKTVWIHNDNAAELCESAFNHYSGITIFEDDTDDEEDMEEEGDAVERGFVELVRLVEQWHLH
ncbi:hypothetical protein diail_11682 [Diaporthe ilicicola]|nr:hypothetical protein diail_11682 [Diaporthe ilicicola]